MGKGGDGNRSNQMNPNNDAYWQSRGYDERPPDWEDDEEVGREKEHRPGK